MYNVFIIKKEVFFIDMVENFEKTIEELDGNVSLETVQNVAVYSDDDLKKYSIDLDSLETKKHNKNVSTKSLDKNSNWQNLDMRLQDVINSFVASSENPVFLIRDDKLVYVNQASLRMMDIEFDKDIIGENFFSLVFRDDWNLLSKNIGEMLTSSKELKIRLKTVGEKIVSVSFKAVYLPETEHFSFLLIGKQIKEKSKNIYNELYDSITGLPSFFLFEDRVQVAVVNENAKDSSQKTSMICVAVLNIDNIDSFRKMNIDDFVIKKIADNLVLNMPRTATVSVGLKYNFWLMFTAKDKNSFNDIMKRMLDVLNEGVSDNFAKHKLLYSIGVSCFPSIAKTSKKLMEQAIKALEYNQNTRKEPYKIFDGEDF